MSQIPDTLQSMNLCFITQQIFRLVLKKESWLLFSEDTDENLLIFLVDQEVCQNIIQWTS